MVSFNQKTYVLLTIIILSIILFICGILHFLMKHFLKPTISESEEIGSATAFQGQLQQLFDLHDEGVDQSSIDSLPIFLYKSIIGLKDPFDCVVCLCEFELHDKLRLLPNCSHAFHVECIDAWLLAHSTCPLCRKSLLHECSSEISSHSSLNVEDDFAHSELCLEKEKNMQCVKLGKFRNVEVCGEGTSRSNCDLKERCFSMGAIEYVMNESTVLQVNIKALKKQSVSDKFNKESFLAPKIETGRRREKSVYDDCSRRAFSFRLPKHISEWGSDLEAGGRSRRQKI